MKSELDRIDDLVQQMDTVENVENEDEEIDLSRLNQQQKRAYDMVKRSFE